MQKSGLFKAIGKSVFSLLFIACGTAEVELYMHGELRILVPCGKAEVSGDLCSRFRLRFENFLKRLSRDNPSQCQNRMADFSQVNSQPPSQGVLTSHADDETE